MPQLKPKCHTVIDMYQKWCKEKLKANPGWSDHYDYLMRMPGVRVLYDEHKNIVMNYVTFKAIIDTYNKNMGDMIIEGKTVYLGPRLGYLLGARIEASYKKLRVRVADTIQARRIDPTHPTIYATDDEYLMIKWQKMYRLPNETVYRFISTHNNETKPGFRGRFSKANQENPVLKTQYKYFPYNRKAS